METQITAVTVYDKQARVRREGHVDLGSGEHTLTLEGLPTTLIEESVRVSGRGADVTIGGVDIETEYIARVTDKEIRAIEDELDALHAQEAALTDENTILTQRLDWLSGLIEHAREQYAKGLARGRTAIDDITQLGDHFSEEASAIKARQREIRREREELDREIEAVTNNLHAARHGDHDRHKLIHVTVEAAAETNLTLAVEYIVKQAFWRPLYDVRLEEETITVTYMAQITQRTGEAWEAVDLAVSTARPSASSRKLELDPWYVAPIRPMPRPAPEGRGGMQFARAMSPSSGEAEEETIMLEDGIPEPQAVQQQATISGGDGPSVTYEIGGRVTVPSDNSPHKTTVAIIDLDVTLDYLCIPKLSEEAHLRATVSNTSPYTLMPGQAAVFHGADFVGNASLELVAPTEEFEVQMGVDDRVRVDRELTRRDVSKKLIGSARRSEFAYQITVTNLLGREAAVTIKDQIPIARHENIKVKLDDASPQPEEHTDLNILTWELAIPAGQDRVITFAYSVEHPRDMAVQGI